MADITLCKGGECPLKETCRRYTTPPNPERQWMFMTIPYDEGKCNMYWGENQDNIYNQLKKIVSKSTLPTIEIKDDTDE
jgi:hypothetical protein